MSSPTEQPRLSPAPYDERSAFGISSPCRWRHRSERRDLRGGWVRQLVRPSLLAKGRAPLGRCKPVPLVDHGVWGDSRGNIYLAEVAPIDRVTRLTPID